MTRQQLGSLNQGVWARLRPVVIKARSIFLRFGTSVQRASMLQAYDAFNSLWLEQLDQSHIPNIGTLCTLVAAHQRLPRKGDVAAAWIRESLKVLEDSDHKWRLPAHEFTETVHRLRSCVLIARVLILVVFRLKVFPPNNPRKSIASDHDFKIWVNHVDPGSLPIRNALTLIKTVDRACSARDWLQAWINIR